MWPARSATHVLRLGRSQLEGWAVADTSLQFVHRTELGATSADKPELRHSQMATALQSCVQALRSTQGVTQPSAFRAIDLVVESAWLPLLAFATGSSRWRPSLVHALAQHRFADRSFGRKRDTEMVVQVDHRWGEHQALAYGMSKPLLAELLAALREMNVHVLSVQPALTWGMTARSRPATEGRWVVHSELDRSLVAWLQGGRIVSLNAGAPPLTQSHEVEQLCAVEAARRGMAATTQRRAIWLHWRDDGEAPDLEPRASVHPINLAGPIQSWPAGVGAKHLLAESHQ